MTDSFTGIIEQLERQKAAIDRALAALREVDSAAAAPKVESPATPEAPTRKRRKFSAAARRKMALAQKSRWAKIKGEVAPPAPSKPERRISPEGMKRIIAATKKRWRLQKAAAKAASAKKPAKSVKKKSTPAPAPVLTQAAG
jgi:hypothetical protein